ncbi:MAG: YHS domain-containing (seleno)protein [Bacteroidia bacterium]
MIVLAISFFLNIGFSQSIPSNYISKHINAPKQIAVSGYDVVAYYIQKTATKGKEEFTVTLAGIKYYFSSASNKSLFLKNPAYFLPQYGGWCAYAMGASGEKVEVDPETFKIVNGKLYLFYNAYFNNTLKTWNKDEAHLKAQADINWTKINK